jgi:hypothetical protein
MAFSAYLTTFLNFFLKYFIPIYFILSLYSINYSGYYKLKFFGYDVKLWGNYFYNIIIFFKNIVYNYKLINIILFSLLLIFSFNYEKIYFFFIIFFVLFFVTLYYLYNNSYKLKIYLEKYFLYFNFSVIIGIIYILKNDNIDFSFDSLNNENYPDFILRIMSPRWLFKNSYNFLFPEYKDEINFLNEGLKFNDFYLKDKYFSHFRNTNLDLDYILIKKSLDKSLLLYKNFINGSNLDIINYFKNIYIMDNFTYLNKSTRLNIIYQQKIHDKLLFNFNFNKSYNVIHLEEVYKNKVFLKYRNTYAKSFLKELGLSKNLVVNTNLVLGNYYSYINNFYESNRILISLDKTIDKYIENIDKHQGISCFENNFILNHIKNKYNDYFLRLKLISLNSIDLLDNKKFNNNLGNFKDLIISDPIKNKYDIYSNSLIYKPEIVLNNLDNIDEDNKSPIKEFIIDKNVRVFDIELYVKYLNKYYKYFNNNSNMINWLNDLFIIMFDNNKKKNDYWNEVMSLKDIQEKDSFNLYRNFMNNILYTYKKDLDIFSYHEFKRDGTHYEDIVLPHGVTKAVLVNDDVKNFYYRFFNYNKDLEIFINSYLWLSLEDSNIRLESFESSIEYNEYLNKYKNILNNYIKIYSSDPDFDLQQLEKYVNNHFKKLINLQSQDKNNKDIQLEIESVLEIKRILKLDFFIKNIILNDDILLNFFIKKDNKYSNSYLYKNNINYIFFDRLSNNYNKNFNIFENINRLKNVGNNNLKLPNNYKDYIFIGLYYDFIYYNKELFKVSDNYNYLSFFFNTETDIYMSEGDLLNKILLNNLNYFKNYLNNLNNFYVAVENDLEFISNNIYKESDNLVLRMQNILRILYDINENKLYDKEPLLLKKLKEVTEEYSFFKEIFSNFNEVIRRINKFNEDMTPNISKFTRLNRRDAHSEVMFLNNENFLKYIFEKDIDIENFKESSQILKEIFDEYNKIINKANSWDELLEKRYIFVDHEPFYNEMCRCDSEIYQNVNYYKLKRQFKYSTWEEALALNIQIKKLEKNIINNTILLEDGQDYLMESINNLRIIETRANGNFIMGLKMIDEIISKK